MFCRVFDNSDYKSTYTGLNHSAIGTIFRARSAVVYHGPYARVQLCFATSLNG